MARRMCSGRGSPSKLDPDVQRRDEPDPVLALAADVEEPAAEGEGDREAREDERGHQDERLLEVVGGVRSRLAGHPREEPVQAGSGEDRLVGGDRVAAGDRDDEPADEEGERGRGERDENSAEPRREPGRDGGRPSARGSRPGRGGSVIRPLLRSARRSWRSRAPPRRRPACTRPRSCPRRRRGYGRRARGSPRARRRRAGSPGPRRAPRRAGGGRTRSRRRRARASAGPRRGRVGRGRPRGRSTTFCWFPPESEAAGVCGPPPRTSNSLRSRRARSIRRRGKSHPNFDSGALRKSCRARFSASEKSSTSPRSCRSSGMWPIPLSSTSRAPPS